MFFFSVLKVNDENSRIQIHLSEAPVPKCHRSATLTPGDKFTIEVEVGKDGGGGGFPMKKNLLVTNYVRNLMAEEGGGEERHAWYE